MKTTKKTTWRYITTKRTGVHRSKTYTGNLKTEDTARVAKANTSTSVLRIERESSNGTRYTLWEWQDPRIAYLDALMLRGPFSLAVSENEVWDLLFKSAAKAIETKDRGRLQGIAHMIHAMQGAKEKIANFASVIRALIKESE